MQPNEFKLAQWCLKVDENLLVKGKKRLPVKPLLTKLLCYFLLNADKVLSVETLKTNVWQQQYLTDSAVKKAISELRKILALADFDGTELIKTEPHQGYRYVGPAPKATGPFTARLRAIVIAAIVVSLSLAITRYLTFQSNTAFTLVEKTAPGGVDGQAQAYTQLVRTTLINALSPHFRVRQLYSAPTVNAPVLSYWIEDNDHLAVTLHNEQNELQWEKRLFLDRQIHQSLSAFIEELSLLLDKPLIAPMLASFNHPAVYDLYVKGKISYYQQGLGSEKAELLFKRSLQLQPQNNPSNAALLDIYGLQVRSVPLSQRDSALQKRLADQVMLVTSQRQDSADNVVALAKYHLVNRGDAKAALKVINANSDQLNLAYDIHIVALTHALNGDKKASDFYINLAEQRFPQRNVVLWYKAMIHLINGQLNDAQIQSQWAQDIAPDWYPLNYIAARLLAGSEQAALDYMARYPRPLLNNVFNDSQSLRRQVDNYFELLEQHPSNQSHSSPQILAQNQLSASQQIVGQWEPFEAEIAYLLAKFYAKEAVEKFIERYVLRHYPEKLMMLRMIDGWYELYR